MSKQGFSFNEVAAVLLAGSVSFAMPCVAAAQEMPDSLAVYEGNCSVLIVNDQPSPKACLGSLVVNSFQSGKKMVLFHNADDEVIAFQATPRQGVHYAVTGLEQNGQNDAATGACTIDLNAQQVGEIRCEAHTAGHVTSGTFQVTRLKHVIGTQ